LSFAFPGLGLECSCSAIHLTASYSVIKPLTTSVSPSGHRISTPQPEPGFFRATKTGRCSDIPRICACGGPVQASYPATIKLTTTLEMGRLPGAGAGSGCAGFMCAGRSAPPHGSNALRAADAFREKAGGRYAVGFSLRLPARFSGAIAIQPQACVGAVNETLICASSGRSKTRRGVNWWARERGTRAPSKFCRTI